MRKTLIRRLFWLVLAGTTAYSAGIVALVALWQYAPQRWWVALANVFAPLWFAPLLLLIPLAALARSRVMGLVIAVPLAIFVVLFGGQIVPPLGQSQDGGQRLRIVTYNQRFDNPQVEQVVEAIRAQRPDIIALQELSPAVAAAFAGLNDEFPYQALEPAENQGGMGLVSRYPLHGVEHLDSTRGQRASVDLNGIQVTLLNVHLHRPNLWKHSVRLLGGISVPRGYTNATQLNQVHGLLDEIDGIEGPLVIVGDFNSGDREPAYQALAARLHDVYRETACGFGFTFPNHSRIGGVTIPFPLVRIDYIWTNDDLTPIAAATSCAGGADHCMVVAELGQGVRR